MKTFFVVFVALWGFAACAPSPKPQSKPDQPYVLILGTAQDGGLPQIACDGPQCRAARVDPALRRLVSSILLVDPRDGRRFLFDATPDIAEQVELARGHGGPAPEESGRPALFDGIFLTHGHMGHYTGLMHLGQEAYGTRNTKIYCSKRMADYLTTNGPWSLMVELGQITPIVLRPDEPLELGGGLRVTPVVVPHRDEFTDTFAFVIEGQERSVLFLPDIDKWRRWERPIEELLERVDVALLDGSFFADGEIPGRDMDEIAHPFIVESIERFSSLPPDERAKVWFTHLNHTNPAVLPGSAASRFVADAGMRVANDGEQISLHAPR